MCKSRRTTYTQYLDIIAVQQWVSRNKAGMGQGCWVEPTLFLILPCIPIQGHIHALTRDKAETPFSTTVPFWRQTTWNLNCLSPKWGSSSILGPQTRFGDKPLNLQVVFPPNGAAVPKGRNRYWVKNRDKPILAFLVSTLALWMTAPLRGTHCYCAGI